ncbi:hypothetical protein Pure05_39930 [Paenarthrobacter ureafaciens]|nr:hypothetical protein Pure01_39940 [Paenarthrobacter ureafaciens]GLU65767.1 hypothetical protein Pure02_40170 [Paenarthrobacter ureafaciens]GLU70080.1 hypothetical protein Pure03_40560 [Paenarthrobacter ureafaciens]GLU74313.1 hypothetical protein Pure04_40280 [Paenarthrobacter ureafaciens]GLU78553.1 hypothetical protein Pure05_39930 [Paenarthrobacter ureafaciens]
MADYLRAIDRIEIAGWLIRQDNLWPGGDGPCNGKPLTFPSRESLSSRTDPMGES